ISAEKSQRCLIGLLLHDAMDGLAAVASDGHRFARVVIPGATGLSQDRCLIVPSPALKIINRLLANKGVERVIVRRSKTLVRIDPANAIFISRLIDDTFPDYSQFIPKSSGNAVTVKRVELIQALTRIAAVAVKRENRVVGLSWTAEPTLRLCLVG